MGKFSEMDILIQESFEKGYKDGYKIGWKEAKAEALKAAAEVTLEFIGKMKAEVQKTVIEEADVKSKKTAFCVIMFPVTLIVGMLIGLIP